MTTLAEAIESGRGIERPFRCHMHDDSNASASVNVAKGVWCCYACGAAGVVDGIDLAPDTETLLRVLAGEEPVRVLPEDWLDLFDAAGPSPYWAGRFGVDVARRHRCGTHPLTGAPTYPVRDRNGAVLGVVTRHDDQPKYKYPFGVPISTTMYGRLVHADVVVLVEGAADVMALDQAGIPPKWTVLGCYGAGVHLPQALIIADLAPKLIVAAFDDDDAGRNAAQRCEALTTIAPVLSHPWGSIGGKDPGETNVQQRIPSIRATIEKSPYGRYA